MLTQCTRQVSLANTHLHTLSHKGYLVACLWSRDQPVSWAQCQLFCICSAYTWHDSGLAGICTKSDHPSYAVAVNCITMQVFHDIAPVTVQLIDWCSHCSNGITGPVKSEIHQPLPVQKMFYRSVKSEQWEAGVCFIYTYCNLKQGTGKAERAETSLCRDSVFILGPKTQFK